MTDFYEIDFLAVETDKSGDAICIRYHLQGETFIHVVDAGFKASGPKMAAHIRAKYDNPTFIDHVVATHTDGDHAGGLQTVLEEFDVGTLWMLRPWIYANELLPYFETYSSVTHLERRLRQAYPAFAELEEIALQKRIPIAEPFQGARIGPFMVLSPSRARYGQLVIGSEKTPSSSETQYEQLWETAGRLLKKAANLVRGAWGVEVFSTQPTSNENEMSVVQFAELCGERILLTADAGRVALNDAADFLTSQGVSLPGIDRFQVPHHGSRRNVSTAVLNRWLGPILPYQPAVGQGTFSAFCSSAKADPHHPRKSVERAMIHRGANFAKTEGSNLLWYNNAPQRADYQALAWSAYPTDYES